MERNAEGTVVSVERVIKAPAAAIFSVVTDATRHPEFDGSGQVKKARDGATEPLTLGATFGMSMKMGLPYNMVNTVIEFEPGRRIAWQSRLSGPLGPLLGGRIWRYELEETGEGTRVTESWDIRLDRQGFLLKRGPVGKATADNMTKSLERLAGLSEASP
jgi:uncharacterized protein YndB with AHSA1/START domain